MPKGINASVYFYFLSLSSFLLMKETMFFLNNHMCHLESIVELIKVS